MLTLTPTERRALRAQAHALSPVVTIGQHGLTPAVLREIDHALNIHELIKVRIFSDDRAEREMLQLAICDQLACAPVQHLGKLIILWRPAPPKAALKKTAPAKRPAKKAAKKALPGAISRHGQAIKPLSARQAREQAQQPVWQPTRQSRDTNETSFADELPANRRHSPRPARSGSYPAMGSFRSSPATSDKSTFQQAKPSAKALAKPPAKQSPRQSRSASGAPYATKPQPSRRQSTNRRRLGARGKV
ncbi:MAG: YhbY family RNA-binding protein [Proteobacteria bacterium]|nr:YhbY family RNA-binding protein [Pseudomonadota bacterium]